MPWKSTAEHAAVGGAVAMSVACCLALCVAKGEAQADIEKERREKLIHRVSVSDFLVLQKRFEHTLVNEQEQQ